jgi:hypothetical protein
MKHQWWPLVGILIARICISEKIQRRDRGQPHLYVR